MMVISVKEKKEKEKNIGFKLFLLSEFLYGAK